MPDPVAEARVRLRAEDAEERRRAIAELPGGMLEGALELLIEALADADWRVRKEAVGRVSRWPDAATAVEQLITVVREEHDVGWRNAALDALAHIGKPAVGPILAEVRRGGDHRKFLVDVLGGIGEPEAGPLLVRLLSDRDPNLRVAAGEALRHIGGSEARAALRGCLAADDLPLRLAALEGLAILHAQVAVGDVRPSLEDSVLRKSALRLLGWSRDPSAVPHLVDALRQPRRALHASAVQALANLLVTTDDDDRAEVLRLLGALGDDGRRSTLAVFASADEGLRRSAAAVLGAIGSTELAAVLAEGMADPSVAEACASALGDLGAEAVGSVLAVAAKAEPDLRADLYDLLAVLGRGGADVSNALRAALDDDEVVAAAAARTAGALGDGDFAADLARALAGDDRAELAACAATALGRLLERDVVADRAVAIEALHLRGLGSPVAEVRAAAALALAAGGALDQIEAVAAQLTDADPYARLAAIRALAELGDAGRRHLEVRLGEEDDAEMADAIRAVLRDAEEGDAGS